MQRSTFFHLLTVLCFTTFSIHAQDIDYRPNLIPPSPDASALGKYAEYPVGLYTGTLPLNIPLYTVKDGSLEVPIELTYHASGNKVDEAASFAGLGFALNAGGAVMRSIRNLPDDYSNKGFLDYSATYSYDYLTNNPNRFVQLEEIAKGCADAEPDAYFFNFNGYTGSFTFDWSGNIVLHSTVAWKTQILRTNSNNSDLITGFKFTSDDGTEYTLDYMENATITDNGFPCQAGLSYTSAWYLSRIKSPNGGRQIDFTYESYTQNFDIYHSVTHRIFCYNGTPAACQATAVTPTTNFTRMVYNCRRVKTITTSDNATTLTFNYLTQRTDEPGTGVNQLNEITVKNKDAVEIRKYTMGYDYSTGRLTLKSIKKTNTDEPPYQFEYSYYTLPPRLGNGNSPASFGQDHWGYNNGIVENQTLVPGVWKNDPNSSTGTQIYYPGANRTPEYAKMQAGILIAITYPSGGINRFTYAPHDYGYIGNQTVESLGEYATVMGGVEEKTVYLGALADGTVHDNTLLTPVIWGEYGDELLATFEFRGRQVPSGTAFVELYNNVPGSQPLLRQTFSYPFAISQGPGMYLPKGQYKLRAKAVKADYVDHHYTPPNDVFPDDAYIAMTWKSRIYTSVLLKKKEASGLRIASITSYADAKDQNPVSKQYIYDDGITPLTTSTGVLNESPFYEYKNLKYYAPGETGCSYDLRIAQNKSMLGYGPHIAYRKVTELNGTDGTNGKTVYTFLSDFDNPSQASAQPPFQLLSEYQKFYQGFSTGQLVYRKELSLYKPVSETIINATPITSTNVYGLKVRFDGGNNTAAKFYSGNYTSWPGVALASSILEKEYSSDGLSVTEKQKGFNYDAKSRLHQEYTYKAVGSSDNFDMIEYFYPDDFLSPVPAVQSLVAKNIIAAPLEIVKQRIKYSDPKYTGGIVNTFIVDGSSRVLQSEIKKLQLASPSSTYDYAWDNATGIIDSRYSTETTFEKFDAKENLTQFTEKNGLTTSALFDKHNSGAVVTANGVAADKIAYTSFENSDPIAFGASWSAFTGTYSTTDFQTGKRSYSGTVFCNVSAFNTTNYILSFWMKGGTGFISNGVSIPSVSTWTYYEMKLNGTSTVAINTNGGLIDEVRIFPADASVTTSSYDQLVGANTNTDAKSKPSYAEYDNLWRLHLVKDKNKDIVKRINYENDINKPLGFTLTATPTSTNYALQFQIVGGTTGYTYEWDYDDLTAITSTTATSTTHTFAPLTAKYMVKVKVKNSVNTLATLAIEVIPTKVGGSTVLCNEIQGYSISRSGTYKETLNCVAPVISGASYIWDFGSGNGTTSQSTAGYSYPIVAGSGIKVYKVSLTITAGSKSCYASESVTIKNP